MDDETHFNLNCNMNIKICVHWVNMNSHAVAPLPSLDEKVTVWRGITGTVVFGLYFFEKTTPVDFVACYVTASRYTAMLQNYAVPVFLQQNALNDAV